jgi:predicted nuclease of predicted toxin-antitoxin system
MNFLVDQDVYGVTVQFLKSLGHDVVTAAQLGLAQASDEKLLQVAKKEDRLFVTRDRDFGNLVFVHGYKTGIVYLRMLPYTQSQVHVELQRILSLYSEGELKCIFLVVEPGRHRIRKLPYEHL